MTTVIEWGDATSFVYSAGADMLLSDNITVASPAVSGGLGLGLEAFADMVCVCARTRACAHTHTHLSLIHI